MFKKCRYCGFKNPAEVSKCLDCGRELPISAAEAKENIEDVVNLSRGKVGEVWQKRSKDFVRGEVGAVKYRFHPGWWMKVKLHRIKRALVGFLWFLAIVGGLVVAGLIYNFVSKMFKGQ